MSFSDRVNNQLIDHNVNLLRFDADARRRIRAHLNTLREELELTLSTVDFSNVARQQRLEGLLGQVDGILKTNYRGMNSTMLKDMTDLATVEQGFATDGINKLLGVDIMSAALTPEKLRALAKNADILGAPAKDWWGRQAARTRNRFATEMKSGFLLGESTQDLVRRVRGTATGKRIAVELADGTIKKVREFAGGLMDVSTREAEALVRTGVQSVANQARLATYQQNKDVIKSIQAQVTLDGRTSEICQAHGAVPDTWDNATLEPMNGSGPWVGPPAWHFNCRSSLVPITYSWQELQGRAGGGTRAQKRIARMLDNNAPKKMRASMTGQVPQGISFEKWLKRQSVPQQLEILGPTKHGLWKEGRLTLGQTLDMTGRPISVRKLARSVSNKPLTKPLAQNPRLLSSLERDFAEFPETGLDSFGKVFDPRAVVKVSEGNIGTLRVGTLFKTNNRGAIFQVVQKADGKVVSRKFDKITGKMVAETKTGAFKNTTAKGSTTPKPKAARKVKGTVTENGTRIVKDPDFSHNGEYHITLRDGQQFTIFRDTGTGWWFDVNAVSKIPGIPPPHLAFTRAEALLALEKRIVPGRTGTAVPSIPTAAGGAPAAPVIESTSYRSLKVGDVFRDTEGVTWKVGKVTTRSLRVGPWDAGKGRFLHYKKGKSMGFTSPKAPTVKVFKKSVTTTQKDIDRIFFQGDAGRPSVKLTPNMHEAMVLSTKTMAENGFNPRLARFFNLERFRVEVFHKGTPNKNWSAFGALENRPNVLGTYAQSIKTIGLQQRGSVRSISKTFTHEFGHHIDYSLFLNRHRLPLKELSKASLAKYKRLSDAHASMTREFGSLSRDIGSKLKLRMKEGIISQGQHKDHWWEISNHIQRKAQSTYSLSNRKEWFAESMSHYYNQGGKRAFMAKYQPKTFNFFETLMSEDMVPLWDELMDLADRPG